MCSNEHDLKRSDQQMPQEENATPSGEPNNRDWPYTDLPEDGHVLLPDTAWNHASAKTTGSTHAVTHGEFLSDR